MAVEWGTPLGAVVGYNIRLERKMSKATRLLFCTTGLLLRIINGDPLLHDVTHVVIDEVHERDRFSDFLLITLRELLAKRHDLKLVLMSATLHAGLFQDVRRGQGEPDPISRLFFPSVFVKGGTNLCCTCSRP